MAWGAWERGSDREIASPLEAAKVEVDRQRQAAQQKSVSFAVFELIEAAGREAQRRMDALLNAPGAGPARTGLTTQQIIEAKALMQGQITADAHGIPWPPRPARRWPRPRRWRRRWWRARSSRGGCGGSCS